MADSVPPSLIEELDAAAGVVYGNDRHHGAKERKEAEEKLMSFRKSKPPFNTCKSLLEGSRHEAVQFQAASALKDAVIREWSNMTLDVREALQQFILNYISENQMSHFIREILSQVVAVIIKMKTVYAKDSSHRESLYRYLSDLMSSTIHEKQLVACSILSALLLEFSLTNKSTSVGLAWNQHAKCKRAFEGNDLKSIFCLTLDVLGNTVSMGDGANVFRDSNGLCKHFLSIAEQILTWSFTAGLLTRRSVMIQAVDEQVVFKPSADWAAVLLNGPNIELFFRLCIKCRNNDDLSRLANSCLIQLATLQGAVLSAPETECQYLKFFAENLFASHGSSQPSEQDALGAASICKNIIESHKLEIWMLNQEMVETFQKFLGFMTELTCFLMARAAEEEANDDESFHLDSLESLLDAWTTVVVSLEDSAHSISSYAMKIFQHFVFLHTFPPDGRRAPIDDSEVDIDEVEEDDRDRFCGQLLSISCLGRTTSNTSILLLASFLEKRIDLLSQILLNPDVSTAKDVSQNLFEDLHWLILVACHTLADEPDGETVLIPQEITQCCISLKNVVSEGATMRLLEATLRNDGAPVSVENVDPVIRLVCAVLRLFHVQTVAVASARCDRLSPQLVQDTLWFLRIWSSSYLMFEEEKYDEIGPALCSAFGADGDCGKHIVQFVVRMTCSMFPAWTSEKTLLEDAAKLLLSLVEDEKKCAIVSSCREFWELGHELCSGVSRFSGLPPVVRQAIASSLVFCGTSHMNMYREKYWEQTLDIVKMRYRTLTSNTQKPMGANEQESFLAILDLLQGVAEASTAENTPLLFNYLSEFLADGSKMLVSYRDSQVVIVSVLELFVQVVHKEICYLHDKKCTLLYNWVLSVLRAYSDISAGLQSRDAEEDAYQDLSLVMELLTQVLNKDFIDFGESDTESHTEIMLSSFTEEVSVSDVVFFGLGIVLPHMNVTLLSYPSLCCQYFKLVTFLCEIYPQKVEQLPESMLSAFLSSLQLGLNSYGEDNCKLSLEALQSLADFCFERPSSTLHGLLRPFTKMVFEVILVHAADMELMRTAGDTFFSILRIEQNRISDLLRSVVECHQDVADKQKLASEFSKLCPPEGTTWKVERSEKFKFIKVLEEVIFNVRGILCVK